MAKVLEFLSRDDLADIECGRHDIDGDNVFANVMEFETVPASEKPFEAHRRYADIHFVISGVERLACARGARRVQRWRRLRPVCEPQARGLGRDA